MTSIKSLADEIRERQQQEVKEASKKRINKKDSPLKGKEEKETRERQDPKPDGRIIGLILDSGKSEEPENDDEPVTPGIAEKISAKETTESREASHQKEINPDPLSGGLSISQLMPAIRQKAVMMTTKHDFERSNYAIS